MKDYIVRATAANAQIRAFAMTSRGLVEQARAIHDLSPGKTSHGRRNDGKHAQRGKGCAYIADSL